MLKRTLDDNQTVMSSEQSEAFFEALIEDIPIGIYVIQDGKFAYVNNAFAKLFKYQRNKLIGKLGPLDLVYPDDHALVSEHIKQRIEGKTALAHYMFRGLCSDGKIIYCEVYGSLSYYERMPAISGTIRDVTERKLSEERIRQDEEKFRLITENVDDLISVLDLDGKRLWNSPSYRNIFSDPEMLKGSDSFQEIHPDDRKKVIEIFRETVKTGIGQRTEYRFLLPNENVRYIDSQGSVIRDETGKVKNVIVVSRDITEKKTLETQLFRAQRMESLGMLAGGIAHDLNNILAPILLSIEILKKLLPDEKTKHILSTLETSVNRGKNIVKQVLTFAKGIGGERVLVQIKHLMKELVQILRETFPKTIKISTDIAQDLWVISVDLTQLHQLLMNLCINARDAMPAGGRLELTGKNILLTENDLQTSLDARPGRYIVLSVTDTGIGISKENLNKIFDPFFTTKEVGKGTGLGLFTVHSIVKNHGGFINLQSELWKGTKFEIFLPAYETTETKEATRQEHKLPTGKGELVLIVDDELSICEITKFTLESFNYRAMTAVDSTEAIVMYAQNKDSIELVITDMLMPFIDGPALILALRKINPAVKIIGTSGSAENGVIEHAKDLSIEGFLIKPYTTKKLLSTIHEVLSK